MVQKFKETRLRTIIKTLILRFIVFIAITLVVVFILNGSLKEGFEIAILDIIIEIITHYFYERAWQKIGWGIIIKDPNDPNKTYTTIIIPSIKEGKEKVELETYSDEDPENKNNN